MFLREYSCGQVVSSNKFPMNVFFVISSAIYNLVYLNSYI